MPQIKCPNCGKVRLVVEGKKKNCRKCGTPLTTNPPKEQKVVKVTAEQLKELYPEQIAEIAETAKNKVVREELGELTTEILLDQYPELVDDLVAAAREDARRHILDEIKKKKMEQRAKAKSAKDKKKSEKK